jgi:hypothetical protein
MAAPSRQAFHKDRLRLRHSYRTDAPARQEKKNAEYLAASACGNSEDL